MKILRTIIQTGLSRLQVEPVKKPQPVTESFIGPDSFIRRKPSVKALVTGAILSTIGAREGYNFTGPYADANQIAIGARLSKMHLLSFESRIFHPPDQKLNKANQTEAFEGMNAVKHFIPLSDDIALHAWYIAPKNGQPTVMFANGNDGDFVKTRPLLLALSQQGLGIMAYEYPGFGKSTGQPTVASVEKSLQAVSDYLVNGGSALNTLPKTPIANQVLMGYSLGTLLIPKVAQYKDYKHIFMLAPFSSLQDAYRAYVDQAGLENQLIAPNAENALLNNTLNPKGAINETDSPITLIAGLNDLYATPMMTRIHFKDHDVAVVHGDHDTMLSDYGGDIAKIIKRRLAADD